jgi:hypothetical protein
VKKSLIPNANRAQQGCSLASLNICMHLLLDKLVKASFDTFKADWLPILNQPPILEQSILDHGPMPTIGLTAVNTCD